MSSQDYSSHFPAPIATASPEDRSRDPLDSSPHTGTSPPRHRTADAGAAPRRPSRSPPKFKVPLEGERATWQQESVTESAGIAAVDRRRGGGRSRREGMTATQGFPQDMGWQGERRSTEKQRGGSRRAVPAEMAAEESAPRRGSVEADRYAGVSPQRRRGSGAGASASPPTPQTGNRRGSTNPSTPGSSPKYPRHHGAKADLSESPYAPGRATSLEHARTSMSSGRSKKGKHPAAGAAGKEDEGRIVDGEGKGDASGVLFLLPTAELKPLPEGASEKEHAKGEKKRAKVPPWVIYTLPLRKAEEGGGIVGKGVDVAAGVAGKAKGVVKNGNATKECLQRIENDTSFIDKLVVYVPSDAVQDVDFPAELNRILPPSTHKKLTSAPRLLDASPSLPIKPLPTSLDSTLSIRPAALCWSLEPTHRVFVRPSYYQLPAISSDDDEGAAAADAKSPQVGWKGLAREMMLLVRRETRKGEDRERWEIKDEGYVAEDLEKCLRFAAKGIVKLATK